MLSTEAFKSIQVMEKPVGYSQINITEGLLKGVPDPGKIWERNKLKPMLEGVSEDALPKKRHVSEYKNLIKDIMRYNYSVEEEEGILAQQTDREKSDTEWLRNQLKERWARRRQTKAWRNFQAYKADVVEENRRKPESGGSASRADEKWGRAKERKVKRAANKEMWEECRATVLADWKKKLSCAYGKPIQQLLNLQAMVDVQRAELIARIKTPQTLISEATAQTDALAGISDNHLCIFDSQVGATKGLLDLTSKNVRRLHTRVSRLAARDVRDEETRKIVVRERLAHPKAMNFMSEGLVDLETARCVADKTKEFLEKMDKDWERVSLAAVDTVGALKDVLLSMDLRDSV